MKEYQHFYIDGEWVSPIDTGTLDVVDSTTEEIMGRIPEGVPQDVERAVAAAKAAFPSWSGTPTEKRAEFLQAIANGLKARQDEMATLISREVGTPKKLALMVQTGLPILVAKSFSRLLGDFTFEDEVGHSLVIREPIGVVGCITPWNYPLHQIMAKVAPALAAGCTVVIKPSEVAPLNAYLLAEIIHETGLPAGVFYLVCGLGPVVGEALVTHGDVDMISFTGSTRAGTRVAELAAPGVKRIAQELGGKSANVILDDADFPKAVRTGVSNCFFNSGQTCSAWTRMLVPRDRYDEAVEIAKQAAEGFTVGDPLGGEAKLGPLISDIQRERVRSYIRKGVEEGARLVTGGPEVPEDTPKGFFVKPTIFADVENSMTIAQEEIFGPVLTAIRFTNEEDAIRIANDSAYGLVAGVWTNHGGRQMRLARAIKTGQVFINNYGAGGGVELPFGGVKSSGFGREKGFDALYGFSTLKTIAIHH